MKKVHYGRFSYPKNFAWVGDASNFKSPGLFCYIKNRKVYNVIENSEGLADCGEIEFSNIDPELVVKAEGPGTFNAESWDGVHILNWLDTRIDKNKNSII